MYYTAIVLHARLSFTFCKYKITSFQLQGKKWKLRLRRTNKLEKGVRLQRGHEFWVCFGKVRTEQPQRAKDEYSTSATKELKNKRNCKGKGAVG